MASGNSKALRKFVAATKFIFHRGFNASRCKAEAKMATARIKLLRNKRKEQIMQIKRDIAKLLESGQEDIARIRVEHVIREQNILAANEIIELFCDLVVNRLPIITKEKKCPVDLKEGISSLIYAAPRCSELPELLRIRDIFEKKYGKDFTLGASELRPDSCVNRLLIEKLSVAKPSGEVKIKAMKAIAKEFQVKWDPAKTEQDLLKPPEERLSGPSSFVSASNLPMRIINQPMQHETNYANNQRYSNSLEEEEDSTTMQFTNSRDEDNATTLQFTNSTKDDDNSTATQFTNSREDNNSTAVQFTDSTAMQFKDTASAAKAAAKYAAKAAQAASSAARLSKQGSSISNNTFESTKNRLSLNGSNGSDSCTDSEEADSKRGRNRSSQRYDNSKEEENSQSFKSTKNRFSLNGSNGSTHPKEEETESCTESEEVDSKRGVFVKFDDSDGLDSDQESKNNIFDEEREYSGGLKNKNGIFGEEREYSGSTGSRVHPKMPDYEELTARFEKLRSSGGKCDH